MPTDRRPITRLLLVGVTAAFVALAGLGVGCGKDDPTHSTTTSFYGTCVDESGNSGTLSLTHSGHHGDSRRVGACEDAIDVDGELNTRGLAPIPIGGSYCPTTGSIFFVSEDQEYQFGGQVAAGTAAGGSFGPGGNGFFVLFLGGTSSNVATFCAPANCTSPVGCQASAGFNVAVSGSFALLTMYYNGMPAYTGSPATATSVDFQVPQASFTVTLHGDISGSTIAGTWSESYADVSGTWSGSTAQCSQAASLRR
jgi:hypothetical protein